MMSLRFVYETFGLAGKISELLSAIGISWAAGAATEAIADPHKFFVVNVGNCFDTSDQPSLSSLSDSSCDFIAKFYRNLNLKY